MAAARILLSMGFTSKAKSLVLYTAWIYEGFSEARRIFMA